MTELREKTGPARAASTCSSPHRWSRSVSVSDITNRVLADVCFMSEDQLIRFFHARTGQSPSPVYWSKVTASSRAPLVLQGRRTVSSRLRFRCGFRSRSSFSRALPAAAWDTPGGVPEVRDGSGRRRASRKGDRFQCRVTPPISTRGQTQLVVRARPRLRRARRLSRAWRRSLLGWPLRERKWGRGRPRERLNGALPEGTLTCLGPRPGSSVSSFRFLRPFVLPTSAGETAGSTTTSTPRTGVGADFNKYTRDGRT